MTFNSVCGSGLIGKGLSAWGFSHLSSSANKIMSRSVKYTKEQKLLLRTELMGMKPDTFVNAAGPSNVSDSISNHINYVEFPWQQCLAQLKTLNELPGPPMHFFVSSGSVYGNTPI